MSLTRASVVAPAKLNLQLLVGPLRDDGYHPVTSLMVALDGLADTVSVTDSPQRRVHCAGVPERDNLAWQALDALQEHIGRPVGCEVTIDKVIPAQAGLGGGSSDAAATLVGANQVLSLGLTDTQLEAIAAQVGSDVPFFIRGGAQWARGRGEQLSPASAPDFAAVLVKPQADLSTPRVYRAFDQLPAPPAAPSGPPPDDFAGLIGWVRNDLWPAARVCAPQLVEAASDLSRRSGAQAVLLCGSGSALAALFATHAQALAAAERVPEALAVVTPARRA